MRTIGTKVEQLNRGDEILVPGDGVHLINNIFINAPFINVELTRDGESHKTWYYASDMVHKIID